MCLWLLIVNVMMHSEFPLKSFLEVGCFFQFCMSCFLLFVPYAVFDHSFSFCINMLLFVNCVCVKETVQPKESVTLAGYKQLWLHFYKRW